MGRVFFIVFLSMLGFIVVAAPRMAIMGAGDQAELFADLLTAELSGEVELLERNAVVALLAERELSSAGLTSGDFLNVLLPVDLFVSVESGKDEAGSYPSRVTVFDAYNGLQLAYMPLPREIERAVETAIGAVRDSINLRESGDFTVISVLTMRGNFTRLPVLRTVEADFLRRMNGVKGVVMAERAHLVRIIAEGRLGVAERAIKESNYFVEMMFARGTDEADFSTILRLVDIADNICFERTFSGESRADTTAMVTAVGEFLEYPVAPVLGTAREEAKRFFNESRMTSDYTRKERLLEAAMALDPDVARYKSLWIEMARERSLWDIVDVGEHIAGLEARITAVIADGNKDENLLNLYVIADTIKGKNARKNSYDDDREWNKALLLNEYFDKVRPRLIAFTHQAYSEQEKSFFSVERYYDVQRLLGPRALIANDAAGSYVWNQNYLENLNIIVKGYLLALNELGATEDANMRIASEVFKDAFVLWLTKAAESPSLEFNAFLIGMSEEFAKNRFTEVAACAPFIKILTLADNQEQFLAAYEVCLENMAGLDSEVAKNVKFTVGSNISHYDSELCRGMKKVENVVANRAVAKRTEESKSFVERYIALCDESTLDDAFVAVSKEFAGNPFASFAQQERGGGAHPRNPKFTDALLARVNPDYEYSTKPIDASGYTNLIPCDDHVYFRANKAIDSGSIIRSDENGNLTTLPMPDHRQGVLMNWLADVRKLPNGNILLIGTGAGYGYGYVEYNAALEIVSYGRWDADGVVTLLNNTIYFCYASKSGEHLVKGYPLAGGDAKIILTSEADLRENDLLKLTGGKFKCPAIWGSGSKLYLFITNRDAAGIWSIDLNNNNAVNRVWDISEWMSKREWKGRRSSGGDQLFGRPVEHDGILYFTYKWWEGGSGRQRVVIAAFDPATETVRGIAGVRPPEAAGITVPDNAAWPDETVIDGDLCIVGNDMWVGNGHFFGGALRFSLSDPSRVCMVPGILWGMCPTMDSRGVFTVVNGTFYKVKAK